MSPRRWAIVGAGAVARGFAADLAHVQGASVVAAYSRTQANADAFVSDFGGTAFTDRDTMLDSGGIDAAYVATPNDRHAADTIACIEAGIPVLCEKPFALSATQARLVVDAARANGVFCMEAMWARYIPAYVEIKRRIDAGELGDVQGVWADFSNLLDRDAGERFFQPELGGGSLLDLGIYGLSLAAFLAGPIEAADGHAMIGPTGVDDVASISLRHAGGAVSSVSSGLRASGPNQLVVATTTSRVQVPGAICNPRSFTIVDPAPGPAAGGRLDGLKKIPGLLKAVRIARGVARRTIARPKADRFGFEGIGYRFEADEVHRCLDQGLLESAVMPLDETVALMEVMDGLRADWGISFPGEDTVAR